MRKRLVMSAALAVIGCADANSGGAGAPPFSSPNWSPPGNGVSSGNEPGAAPDPATGEGAGTNAGASAASGSTPSTPASASEGQNASNLPIAPTSGQQGSGSGAAPSDTSGTPQQGNGMGQANDGQANNGQASDGQANNGMQSGATPAPEPAPRPALDCNAQPALNGGTQACTVNASGRVDDQSWFLWYSGSGGCITTYDSAAFKASWNNSGDFLARMGLAFDETKTFDQYGTIGADLAFTKTGTAGGYSFIGIYGWSNNPLVEYYIVENSFANGPQTPYATQQKGTFTVDGASYKVFQGTKTNQPSIHGTATFQQFFSVRQTPRTCGHVSITEHFKAWASMGMALGKMYEARILVEAGGGSGGVNFTTAYVSATAN